MMDTGLHYGLDIDEYHAGPGISNSGLADIDRSPWHYYALNLDPNRPPRREKAGQLEGNLAHTAILEPDEFDKRYAVVPPDAPRRPSVTQRNAKKPSAETVKAIDWWDEWHERTAGATTITEQQRDTAMRQRDSVWALPDVAAALSKGQREVSAYWTDPETSVLCRCRPDFVHEAPAGVVLLDVKTCSDASPADFARHIARKGYHRQGSFYPDGYEIASEQSVLAFIFVAVECEWPYAASAVMLDDESQAAGRILYRRNLNTYAACLNSGHWPGYSESIELVSLPRYAMEYAND